MLHGDGERVLLELQNDAAHARRVLARTRGLGVEVTQLGDALPLCAGLDSVCLCDELLLGVPAQRRGVMLGIRRPYRYVIDALQNSDFCWELIISTNLVSFEPTLTEEGKF